MKDNKRTVAVLGATGSVGGNTAKVLEVNQERFKVLTLAANSNIQELARQAKIFAPQTVITADPTRLTELQNVLPAGCCGRSGIEAMVEAAVDPELDVLLCAIVGTAGIAPVLAALEAGKTVALASKEVMVSAGELVLETLQRNPQAKIVPVDSEHSGVFQCLAGVDRKEIAKIRLTASGGPFRTWSREKIENASLEETLAHPTWSMGCKITIDSASMMNKALELVEAKFLFGVGREKLAVLVNPQSAVHAMVEMVDGTLIAQVAAPDMQQPIAYGLSYPERLSKPRSKIDLAALQKLEFFAPDREKFPSFDFADAALDAGGTLPCAMNAANEVAVERFRKGEINFGGIWKIVGEVMEKWQNEPQSSFAQITEAENEARRKAAEVKI